ncbi:hypothetical protein HPB49_003509 [Dermacentor silvarum]|uniref:Uncharacterized protein n=1 Tax=Dermacentor silvarum TaxID=543639 RepID=A0ACB8DMP3_DERSI|nr:hypothetical protein HPB49_003509 [Dermacentor silvarum]
MLKPHVMEITVEGDAITEDELNDGSWTAFEAQRKYSRRNTSAATPSANCTEGASPEETAKKPPRYRARQPTLPRHRPLPKLPEEHLKVVIRPQGAINMRYCGSAAVLQAVCAAIDADAEDVLKNDQIRVHRINNTVIISTPSLARAQAYKDINSLKFDGQDYRMLTYVPAPDNSSRGVFYHAWSGEGDAKIYKELQERNPELKLAGARRLGSSRHVLITVAEATLPAYVRYFGDTHDVYPFRERVEACFNCRKTGHRTDVCPLPRRVRCRRCGSVEHETPPPGTPATCWARCIVCHGGHPTGARTCRYRFYEQFQGKSTTRNTEATSKWKEPTETPFMEVSNTEDGNTAYRDALCRSRPVTRNINQGASGARTNSAHHRSGSRHRSNSRPRGDNRQRPASMTEKDQEPGKSVLRQPSTPDDAARGRRPEDTQVRELAAEIRNLKKQLAITNDKLAAANEEIKFLKSKQTKITTTPPATREILACVRKDDSQDMEVVEGRNPKRKLVEPTSMAAPDTSGPTTLTKRMDKLEEFLNNFVQEVDNRMQVMQETMQKGIETCMVLIAKQSSATQTGHSSKEVQPSAAVIALTPNPPAKSNNMKGLKMVTSFPTRAEPYAKGNDGGIN